MLIFSYFFFFVPFNFEMYIIYILSGIHTKDLYNPNHKSYISPSTIKLNFSKKSKKLSKNNNNNNTKSRSNSTNSKYNFMNKKKNYLALFDKNIHFLHYQNSLEN